MQEIIALLGDRGVGWAEGELTITNQSLLTSSLSNKPAGDVHKRQRRAVAPAFGPLEAKGLLPYFMGCVTKARELLLHLFLEADSGPLYQMADKWGEIIENGKSEYSAVIDMNAWLGKATLDACVSTSVRCAWAMG